MAGPPARGRAALSELVCRRGDGTQRLDLDLVDEDLEGVAVGQPGGQNISGAETVRIGDFGGFITG